MINVIHMVEEAKTVGAAMAHENANWEECQALLSVFFRGRDLAHLIGSSPNRQSDRARTAEYRSAYDAFCDAYYGRA